MGCVLIVIELLIPIISERNFTEEGTPWHPDHIEERYGLLVITVLGEGIFATTDTISSLITVETKWEAAFRLGFVAAGLIFSLWWPFLKMSFGQILNKKESSLVFSLLYGWTLFCIRQPGCGRCRFNSLWQMQPLPRMALSIRSRLFML